MNNDLLFRLTLYITFVYTMVDLNYFESSLQECNFAHPIAGGHVRLRHTVMRSYNPVARVQSQHKSVITTRHRCPAFVAGVHPIDVHKAILFYRFQMLSAW